MDLMKVLTTVPKVTPGFKVLGGDFGDGHALIEDDFLRLPGGTGRHWIKSEVASLERVSQSNLENVRASLGWGAAGALALGPIGLLAAPLMARRKTETRVVFLIAFNDGRKLLGEGDESAWVALLRAKL